MNNPLDIIRMIKNPKQFVMNYAQKNNNPMLNNLIDMANKNDKQGVEKFANNILKEQEQDLNDLMNLLK